MSAERIARAKATPSVPEDISGYENITKEELIRELVLAKINEARAKKGYEVKEWVWRRNISCTTARIYKSEEAIGGLPINMEGFCLFDTDHRTSKPLNLTYKAAQLADLEKADDFLKNLRHATVIDCRPTTHMDVILDVVRATEIDKDAFLRYYNDGSAEAALQRDLLLRAHLGIHSVPACLVERNGKALLLQSFAYGDYVNAIESL